MKSDTNDQTLEINGRLCRDQHDLMMAVLLAAGASDAEELKPQGAASKIADAVFQAEDWIFEIKSLVADRPNNIDVQSRIASGFEADNQAFGGPIVFGTVNIRLDQMPGPVAHNILRRMGNSVQEGAKAANKQIRATKQVLEMPDARGCVVIVSPHFDLTPDVQRWLVTDAIRGSRLSSVHTFVLCQTAMLAKFGHKTFDSAMQFYDRTDDRMPIALKKRIAEAWTKIHRNKPIEGMPPERPTKWRLRQKP